MAAAAAGGVTSCGRLCDMIFCCVSCLQEQQDETRQRLCDPSGATFATLPSRESSEPRPSPAAVRVRPAQSRVNVAQPSNLRTHSIQRLAFRGCSARARGHALIMPARVISNTPGDPDSDLCQGSLASTDADDEQLRGAATPTVHQFACFRESPRPCINQELVNQLAPLRAYRFLKYGSGLGSSPPPPQKGADLPTRVCSRPWKVHLVRDGRLGHHRDSVPDHVGRASAQVAQSTTWKALAASLSPYGLTHATHRKQIGPKLINKIDEFLKTGTIQEARTSLGRR